jgi:hypothetical protein
MNKQQTAVEWLEAQMPTAFKDLTINLQLFQEAKAMEKQQIIQTWHNGYNNQSPMIDEKNCGQQYYNETFKNK